MSTQHGRCREERHSAAELQVSRWALRGSNPQPSPCKGEEEVLVRGLSRDFGCHRSALVYLGVTLSCYASVTQNRSLTSTGVVVSAVRRVASIYP